MTETVRLNVRRTGAAIKVREDRGDWFPVVADFARGEVGEAMFAVFVANAASADFVVFDEDRQAWLTDATA